MPLTRNAAVLLAALCGAPVAVGQIEARWLNPVNGVWNSGARWSTGFVPNNNSPPGASYHAIIDAQGSPYWVDFYGPDTTLSRFTLNSADATFYHNTNTIQILDRMDILAGMYRFELNRGSGTTAMIRGGTLSIAPSASFVVTGVGGTPRTAGILDGVAVNGRIDLLNDAVMEIRNGLVLNGTIRTTGVAGKLHFQGSQTVTGGTLAFDGPAGIISAESGNQLTLSPSTLVRGGEINMGIGGAGGLIRNHGTISGDVANPPLGIVVGGTRFENTGTAQAINGGKLDIGPRSGGGTLSELTWTNTGILRLGPNSRLTLGGRFSTSDIGTVERSGGQLVFAGDLNNQNSTLVLDSVSGPWFSDSGIIRGGQVITTPGGGFQFRSNPFSTVTGGDISLTLDGTRLVGDLNITETGALVHLPHGLEFTGALRMGGNATGLLISNQSTLRGPQIVLGNASGPGTIEFTNGAELTIAEETLVTGYGGIGAHFPFTFPTSFTGAVINRGTLVATNPAERLALVPRGPIINYGTIRGDNALAAAGWYSLPDSFDNRGRVEAINGGWVFIGSQTVANVSGGTLNGGTWEVAGFGTPSRITFENQPVLSVNNATVILRGPNSLFPSLDRLSTNNGSLTLDQGRLFTTFAQFSNPGQLVLGTEGSMLVTTDFTQAASGLLNVSLTPDHWGRLTANGTVSLAGGLMVTAPDPSAFSFGQSFTVVLGASRIGTFGSVNFPALSNGLSLQLAYTPASAIINVVPAPAAIPLLVAGCCVGSGRRRRTAYGAAATQATELSPA